MKEADQLAPSNVDRSTISADSGQVKSQSSPEWINNLSKREQSRTRRSLTILATLAREGPLTEREVGRQSHENRSSTRRTLKLLNEADMVHYKPGERKANIYDVTSFGLFFCFLQHYLNSEEFVACIAKRSKLISILGAAEDISLKKLISETAKLTWAMAYYEAIHSTLADLRIPQSKHDTEHAEDACYFELIRGVGSVEALEWALMTRLLEHLGNRRIRQYIKKLTVEERAEIRNKLVEASESYSSARTVLNHINNLLNKTIQIFDKSDS